MSVKSNMTSLTPFVSDDGGKLNFISRPRRFYIDDILASDFGHHYLEECRSVSCENQWSVVDTAAGDPSEHPNIADTAIQLNNGTASELKKSTFGLGRPSTVSTTSLRPPSSSMTSSRRLHDNDTLADTSSNTGCSCRTALKDAVKMEPRRSTGTEATTISDTASTVCDVTSSTTSHPVATRKPGWKADSRDSFTLPAWVYCTRYSDRPSAGNI